MKLFQRLKAKRRPAPDACCDPRKEPSNGFFGERTELIFAITAGVFWVAGWVSGTFFDPPRWAPMSLYLAAYMFGGLFAFRASWRSLLAGRFNIDFLMLVAAAGAAVLGEWFEGALLLFLFSLGHALEHYAMGHARRAIESLADLAPDTARVRRNGQDTEVPVEELKIGDKVVVRTNERLPADGFVVAGSSDVNQAPVTGESVPVTKAPVSDADAALLDPKGIEPEHRVFAGTINSSGSLEIIVTTLSTESTLARVVELVRKAEIQRSPTQRFADRFERVFVPAVLCLVLLLLFAWLVVNEPFTASFYRAMAVLVAASPCALAIATPSAVLSGIARAGRGGVLVKGGEPLEHLGALSAIAFDKTGTLTEGTPHVTDVIATREDLSAVPAQAGDATNMRSWDAEAGLSEQPGSSTHALLETAVAVERLSDHPLAKAVIHYATENGHATNGSGEPARNLENLTGRGIRATLNGDSVTIGKPDLFDDIEGPPPPDFIRDTVAKLEERGRTTMVVRRGDRYLGVIGVMDTPRKTANETLARLRKLGIKRMLMLSGDNQNVADAVADAVDIDEARGDLLPEDKVEYVQALSDEGRVAMVGDGVNDAPAMARATVGVAMGAAGSDVALETADVALMSDKLEHLPFAVGLSRKARTIIRQNLLISLGMVLFLVPATILGLRIGPAVALHEGSTLVVVLNALRLLGYSDRADGTSWRKFRKWLKRLDIQKTRFAPSSRRRRRSRRRPGARGRRAMRD